EAVALFVGAPEFREGGGQWISHQFGETPLCGLGSAHHLAEIETNGGELLAAAAVGDEGDLVVWIMGEIGGQVGTRGIDGDHHFAALCGGGSPPLIGVAVEGETD